MNPNSGQHAKQIVTVSQLTKNIKRILEESFPFIWISGEISNIRIPSSGHAYFTLKDEKAQISAVAFKGLLRKLLFDLQDGNSIVGLCRVTVYEPRGTYQVIFEYIEPKGVGALQLAFEQLKQKLAQEGLFDQRHKKRIPPLPSRIGVITSHSGAAVRDIVHVVQRRFPNMRIDIFPVRVQGESAADEIIRALQLVQRHGLLDVVIIARGGGSLEDLAPFNSEALARAIFESALPVVSAVGHETDYTIADFVADLRAPTPSAAAELVVPVKAELVLRCLELKNRCRQCIQRLLKQMREQQAGLTQRLVHPKRNIEQVQQVLDDYEQRLGRALRMRVNHYKEHYKRVNSYLLSIKLNRYVEKRKTGLDLLNYKLSKNIDKNIDLNRNRLRTAQSFLEALNPKAVLSRGYSITRSVPDLKVVASADTVDIQQKLEVLLAKGRLDVTVARKYDS